MMGLVGEELDQSSGLCLSNGAGESLDEKCTGGSWCREKKFQEVGSSLNIIGRWILGERFKSLYKVGT
jgi:hypothetical protein